jgi:hypothetical protein
MMKKVRFSNNNLVTYINMDAGSKTGFMETLIHKTKPQPFIFNTGLCDKISSTTLLNIPTQLPKLKSKITKKYTQKQTAGKKKKKNKTRKN